MDETDRKLITLLRANARAPVATLARAVGLSRGATQNRVSEHMNCLVWCGFVESRVEGRRTLYRVTNREVVLLMDQAKRFLDANEAQIACRRVIDDTLKES